MGVMKRAFKKLKVGESMLAPWSELGPERPEKDAFVGLGDKIFHMEPEATGVRITRSTQAAYEEWKKSLDSNSYVKRGIRLP